MKKTNAARLVVTCFTMVLFACCGREGRAQDNPTLEQRIKRIMTRPEFAHSRFGIKFISADSGDVIYELNSPQLFVPGSTTKLLSAGTALELLGADYRFHTKIYRTGPIGKEATLQGDLVLVARGEPNLSDRSQPPGPPAFEKGDHSYSEPLTQAL